MSRLDKLRDLNHPILTCYMPVGDPRALPGQAQIYAEQGVDIYEVGIPCADPFMDGDLIRNSMSRVLGAGVTQADIRQQARLIRERYRDKAVVLMGYENMDLAQLKLNADVSFDGLLKVGAVTSAEEDRLNVCDISRISFIPNTLPEDDITRARCGGGYVMLQAAAGKTGLRQDFDMSNRARIEKLRRSGIEIPILLGVGISNAEQVRLAMDCGADGVIIGSACVAAMLQGEHELRNLLQGVRSALDGE